MDNYLFTYMHSEGFDAYDISVYTLQLQMYIIIIIIHTHLTDVAMQHIYIDILQSILSTSVMTYIYYHNVCHVH